MKTNQKFRIPISLSIAILLAICLTAYSAVAAPNLTIVLNDTMDEGTPLVDNFTGATAILLDTMNNTVATATFPDSTTAQFDISNINPGDYFVEVNGLAGDHLPTRIDSNTSDVMQTAGKALINSVIGDLSNPTYRIKAFPSGNPPIVDSSHQVINYTTGMNETLYNFVIVPGNSSKIEIRSLDTSAELNNFSTDNPNHNGLSVPFQQWILGDFVDSAGVTIGNHGQLYDPSADTCSGCHTNLGVKPTNFSDVTPTNGWCFRCHNGPTGPDSGFLDVRLGAITPPIPPQGNMSNLTIVLNDTMDGMSAHLIDNFTGASAILLDTMNNTVATATFPDNMTAQFDISNISPGDYFVEINGLAGDLLPTRIGNNTSDIMQTVGKRLRNSVIGDLSNPTYRIKVYPSGNPPIVNSSHQVVNYSTGMNETTYGFVIVSGSSSKIEIRSLGTSEELNNFSTDNLNHNGLSTPFQQWILGDFVDSAGAFIGNHGHLYNASADTCSGCHTNLGIKPTNFSDVTSTNGWCFRCHNGPNGPRDGFLDVRLGTTTPPVPPQGNIWNVDAGGQNASMSTQGMAFYPGIITVNVGDTVKWTVKGNFHTISFLSGQAPPPDGSPESLAPSGGSMYDGTGFVSSGILQTGNNYSVTFSEPGIFAYRCLIHPGMQGIVIVQPSGSAYPLSQEQYVNQSKKDLAKDIAVGEKLAGKVAKMITSSPGSNNTTNWQTFIDIPLSEKANVKLKQVNSSNATGAAILNMTSPAVINVTLNASGLEPSSGYMVNIKIGTCKMPGSTVFTVGSFNADTNGNALLMADVGVTPPSGIMNRGWIVEVDNFNAEPVACGNVVKHDAARMRFASLNLNITQGDTVTWTQLNPMEIHTISFLGKNQTPPPLLLPGFVINPDVANSSGTDIYNGTGFFNSGILIPGASYSLTFAKHGYYRYVCLIHDEMKMVGFIIVSPKGP
jgi:plastocyanin